MIQPVNESVDTLVIYRRGAPHPLLRAFRWRDRRYDVSETFFVHRERDGASIHFCYSVGSGSDRFELRLDTEFGRWILEAIDASG